MPAPAKFDMKGAVPLGSDAPAKFDMSTAVPLDEDAVPDFSAPKDNKEGTYMMAGPDTKDVIDVPYSKVMDAYNAGFKIDPRDHKRYANDRTEEIRRSSRSNKMPEQEFVLPKPTIEVPEAFDIVTAAPEPYTKDWFKQKAYSAARGGVDVLPTVGSVVGGVLAGGAASETGPAAVLAGALGAAAGAAFGEGARQQINEHIFGDPRMSVKESSKEIAKQAGWGAVGEGSGRVAGKVLGPTIKKFTNAMDMSTKTGIPLLASEAAGKAPSYLERLAKGGIFSAEKMEQYRTMQNTASRAAVTKIADSIANYRGDREGLGKMIKAGITKHQEEFHAIQKQMYADIGSQVGEREILAPVQKQVVKMVNGKPMKRTVTVMQKQMFDNVMPSTKPLKQFAKEKLKELSQVEQVLDPSLLKQSRTMLQTLANAPDNITFSAMRNARSDALSKVRELEQALAGKQAGLAKKMAGLFDESIMDAVQKSKIPGLEQAVRDADAFTRQEHEMFEQKLLEKIVDTKKPEVIATFIRGGTTDSVGLQETRDLFKILPKQLHAPVQRQILLDTLRQSTNVNTKVFSERKFAESLAKMGEERGSIVFGRNWKNIKELADVLAKINGPSGLEGGGSGAAFQNIGTVKSIMALIGSVGGAAAGAQHGAGTKGQNGALDAAEGAGIGAIAGGAVGIGGSYIGFKALATALTNPELTTKVLKLLRGMIKYGAATPKLGVNIGTGQKKLDETQTEGIMRSPSRVKVVSPDGRIHFFPNQKAADNFREAAGIE